MHFFNKEKNKLVFFYIFPDFVEGYPIREDVKRAHKAN
jgi:hypothetical protein